MKSKVLVWSDSSTVRTGFGVVSRHILGALHKTGLYEINHLAINYHGAFVKEGECPWQQVPAKLGDPSDPYGNKMFLKSVAENDYDIIFIINDTYVVHRVSEHLQELLSKKYPVGGARLPPAIIYYFPVDCHVPEEWSGMVKLADIPITYTEYGFSETLKSNPGLKEKLRRIRHGTDVSVYQPLPPDLQKQLKKRYINADEDTFVFINVNRNSHRKQLTRTLLAFKEFKSSVPNCKMYIHTTPVEKNINLFTACKELGLDPQRDVIMPLEYSPSQGFYPDQVLNELYNMADCFITTHLGEGWGLTVTEAMAAAVPVVAPWNTSMPEIVGTERGYLYPCKEKTYIDSSGYRPLGLLEDILSQMHRVYRSGHKYTNQKVIAAREWVKQNTWDHVNAEWLKVFEDALILRESKNSFNVVGEIL